jgi:hypothetical protein
VTLPAAILRDIYFPLRPLAITSDGRKPPNLNVDTEDMPSTNARAVFSEDIPGSSLKGRNPASFKVELRFWLKCHGAKNFSALENKKSLVQMVNTYIANGWDDESFLTDPSPEKVFKNVHSRF